MRKIKNFKKENLDFEVKTVEIKDYEEYRGIDISVKYIVRDKKTGIKIEKCTCILYSYMACLDGEDEYNYFIEEEYEELTGKKFGDYKDYWDLSVEDRRLFDNFYKNALKDMLDEYINEYGYDEIKEEIMKKYDFDKDRLYYIDDNKRIVVKLDDVDFELNLE